MFIEFLLADLSSREKKKIFLKLIVVKDR
jgi:hypothetical protein